MIYNIERPWETLDDWQKEYIETEKNCFLLCGRQSGKSTAMSIKAGLRAVENKNRKILVCAYTENQAYALFFKILMFLETKYPKMICKGNDKPTKHEIRLKNGSRISCYAVGLAGEGIRHFTLTDLFVDEAAPMSREVFTAISPMLSVTNGTMDISSTPRGKEGYFYECSKDDSFVKFYVSAEDCPRHSKEFLENEKKRLTNLEYAQEYLAQFLDDVRRFYKDELLSRCCSARRDGIIRGKAYLGIDCAGLGNDKNSFEIVCRIDRDNFRQFEHLTTEKKYTTETSDKAILLSDGLKIKKIGVDDGGVGFGVFSELLRNPSTRDKTVKLNNSSRSTDAEGKKKTKLLKEDMYLTLLLLMEQGKIKLLDDEDLIMSLRSIQIAEENGKIIIWGNDSHATEGLIRAVYLAFNDESLDLFCA